VLPVEGADVVVGAFWCGLLPPVDPHAAAPTPIIATQTIGAIRRRHLLPTIVLIRLTCVIPPNSLARRYGESAIRDHFVKSFRGSKLGGINEKYAETIETM
jgi:hypothetical protein